MFRKSTATIIFLLIGLALLVFLAGCESVYVGATDTGEKIEITPEEYAALPPEVQAKFQEMTGFDKSYIEQKVDPVTGTVTNVLTVTKQFLPEILRLPAEALLALLLLWGKIKHVRVARGSKIVGQAIEVIKKHNGDTWKGGLKPEISNRREYYQDSLLKPIMPDQLL